MHRGSTNDPRGHTESYRDCIEDYNGSTETSKGSTEDSRDYTDKNGSCTEAHKSSAKDPRDYTSGCIKTSKDSRAYTESCGSCTGDPRDPHKPTADQKKPAPYTAEKRKRKQGAVAARRPPSPHRTKNGVDTVAARSPHRGDVGATCKPQERNTEDQARGGANTRNKSHQSRDRQQRINLHRSAEVTANNGKERTPVTCAERSEEGYREICRNRSRAKKGSTKARCKAAYNESKVSIKATNEAVCRAVKEESRKPRKPQGSWSARKVDEKTAKEEIAKPASAREKGTCVRGDLRERRSAREEGKESGRAGVGEGESKSKDRMASQIATNRKSLGA